jgi:hypothetical protein
VASRLEDGQVVEHETGGIVHRYRVLDGIFEPKGREPTAQEQAETKDVPLRCPPKAWGLDVNWRSYRNASRRE